MKNKLETMINNATDEKLLDWLNGFLTDWLVEHFMIMDQAVAPFIIGRRAEIEEALKEFEQPQGKE